MSESRWRNKSAPIIARIIAENIGLDESAIKLILREAYPFGPRKHHPYKIWLDEIARQFGKKPKLGSRASKQENSIYPDPDPRQQGLF